MASMPLETSPAVLYVRFAYTELCAPLELWSMLFECPNISHVYLYEGFLLQKETMDIAHLAYEKAALRFLPFLGPISCPIHAPSSIS